MKTKELLRALDAFLEPEKFKDYAPNGLQVEGSEETTTVVCGVTASLALIEKAKALGAETLIVHHGYFWKSEDPRIIGVKQRRLKALLGANMNLLAYHLPLDAHPTIGNNVLFGQRLGVRCSRPLEAEALVTIGQLCEPVSVETLANRVGVILNRTPMVVSVDSPPAFAERVAWCTGAAQDCLEAAAREGADVYISGEISERTVLESRELNVPYFAAGHHATETLGISALADWLRMRFPELKVSFIDIDNPV